MTGFPGDRVGEHVVVHAGVAVFRLLPESRGVVGRGTQGAGVNRQILVATRAHVGTAEIKPQHAEGADAPENLVRHAAVQLQLGESQGDQADSPEAEEREHQPAGQQEIAGVEGQHEEGEPDSQPTEEQEQHQGSAGNQLPGKLAPARGSGGGGAWRGRGLGGGGSPHPVGRPLGRDRFPLPFIDPYPISHLAGGGNDAFPGFPPLHLGNHIGRQQVGTGRLIEPVLVADAGDDLDPAVVQGEKDQHPVVHPGSADTPLIEDPESEIVVVLPGGGPHGQDHQLGAGVPFEGVANLANRSGARRVEDAGIVAQGPGGPMGRWRLPRTGGKAGLPTGPGTGCSGRTGLGTNFSCRCLLPDAVLHQPGENVDGVIQATVHIPLLQERHRVSLENRAGRGIGNDILEGISDLHLDPALLHGQQQEKPAMGFPADLPAVEDPEHVLTGKARRGGGDGHQVEGAAGAIAKSLQPVLEALAPGFADDRGQIGDRAGPGRRAAQGGVQFGHGEPALGTTRVIVVDVDATFWTVHFLASPCLFAIQK